MIRLAVLTLLSFSLWTNAFSQLTSDEIDHLIEETLERFQIAGGAVGSLDEEGKAESIKMKGISPNIDFSFDFQDLDLRRVE